MNGMISFFLRNRVAANVFALFLVVGGVIGGQSLVVRLFPDVTLYGVNIVVPFPGASPEEVEESIVEPIEEAVEGLEGVRKITSLAAENTANIIVFLYEDQDIDDLVNEVRTQVNQISVFPQDAEEPVIAELEAPEIVAQVVLSGPIDRFALKQTAQRFRNRLVATPEISQADIIGVPDYLVDIEVSEDRLRALGLNLPALSQLLSENSLDLSGGEVETESRRTLIRTLGESMREDEFKEIIVGVSETGVPIRLDDIAKVRDGLAESPERAELDGMPALTIRVNRVGDERVFEVVDALKREMERFSDELPAGVNFTMWEDQSTDLQARIDLLIRNAVIGFALVVVLLLLFLDVRIAFWVAVGVALSFIGTLILMALFDVPISQLSLFGFILAIGIVVDDAIVVGENIYATAETREHNPEQTAYRGSTRVLRPVLFAVSTTIVAFSPLIGLPGTFGQFLSDIALVVIFVLILSLVESFLILPRHLSHFDIDAPAGRFSIRRFTDPLRDRVASTLDGFSQKRLKPAIRFSVCRPITVILTSVGALVATFGLLQSGLVKVIFFPAVEGNIVIANVRLAESASEHETEAAARKLMAAVDAAAERVAELRSTPVERVVVGTYFSLGRGPSLGGPADARLSGGAAANDAYVSVQIEDAVTRRFSAEDFEKAWREAVGNVPGAEQLTFNSDLTGAGPPVALQLAGENDDNARAALGLLRAALEKIPGAVEIRDDRFRTTDELQISLLPQARSYGLSLRDIALQVRGAFFGAEAVRIQRDQEEIEVRLRYTAEERSSIETLMKQRIFLPNGTSVPLSQLATVEVGQAPAVINRENGQRVFALESNVDTSISTADEITTRLMGTAWPGIQAQYPNVEVIPGAELEDQMRTQTAMSQRFGLALLTIYILLALVFGSYSQPLVVMSIIPFGLIGAVIGHAIMGLNMTLLSMFGVIALSGVIINDSLLMVDYINEALEQGKERFQAVIDSAVGRFRPILLTSMTTFLGVTPIILERGVQAQFLVPTAVALGFGILFGTVILMLLIPATASLHLRLRGDALCRRLEKSNAHARQEASDTASFDSV